ncbi:MAG: hypothetical protein J6V07_04725, partial [Clostridia bacterium]|nr:hypothetical protein [Clostridia bacterium]
EGDEAKNTPGARFCARSHGNREMKDGAMLLRASTIFPEGQTRAKIAKEIEWDGRKTEFFILKKQLTKM